MKKARCGHGLRKRDETRQCRQFCREYLRTLDPVRAAEAAGLPDGFDALAKKPVQRQLERMRQTAAAQIRREDVLRRLAQLAFGQTGDVVRLAIAPSAAEIQRLDLSAVAEVKVTYKGSVEIKLIDRIRALETLLRVLEEQGDRGTAELCQVLQELTETESGWEHE